MRALRVRNVSSPSKRMVESCTQAIACEYVKDQLRKEGIKISQVKRSDILLVARELIAKHPEIRRKGKLRAIRILISGYPTEKKRRKKDVA